MRNSPDFDRTSPELGQRVDVTPRRSSNLLRAVARSASLAFASLILSGSLAQADEGIKFVDDGTFPQCTGVSLADRSILYRHPLDYLPLTPFNPQIRRAMETLQMNGIHNLLSIDILPQGTKLRFHGTVIDYRCLPDSVASPSRYFIQAGEGSGVGLPTGSFIGSPEDGFVEVTLPEGINPIVLRRRGQDSPWSEPIEQEWILFLVGPDEEINFRNHDGGFSVSGRSSLAFITARFFPDKGEFRLVEFVTPERGFADDIMLYPH